MTVCPGLVTPESEHTARPRRRLARRWRASAAGRTLLAVLAVPAAVTGLPAPAGAAPAPVTPADQFRGVSCTSEQFCMGVGWYIPSDGIKRPLAEQWNGFGWQILFPPVRRGAAGSELNTVSCLGPSVCLALGDTTAAENTSGRDPNAGKLFAERWNGSTWRMVPITYPKGTSLSAISCARVASCFAVGELTGSTGAVAEKAVTERWNGQFWSFVPPRRPALFSTLSGVSCPGPKTCYASGWTKTGRFAVKRPLIERWNGTRWSTQRLPAKPRNGELLSVSCPIGTQCTAVGSTGIGSTSMLAETLSAGRWTAAQPASKSVAGSPALDNVSCSAPRICSAMVSFTRNNVLQWGFASRGQAGGWHFQVPGDVHTNTPNDLSCPPDGACMMAGALGNTQGQGIQSDIGTTMAWQRLRSAFFAVPTPPPPATVHGH